MIIKVDSREHDLLQQIIHLVTNIPVFKSATVVSETLPIGDIIISDGKEDKIIIERKSVYDLLASIKDGRYEEQSYRLNGLNHHNHNIVYLIEGDINRVNRFKTDNRIEKLTLYSAMFSLNYYKGFSVFRTFSLEESATIICNMAYKLEKEPVSGKKAFYKVIQQQSVPLKQSANKEANEEQKISQEVESDESTVQEVESDESTVHEVQEVQQDVEQSDKDYVSVVKKVKKENITCDNIGEIMLCQIPGISSVSALAIMDKYKTLPNLLNVIAQNNDCLKDVSYTNAKGQSRKISKTCAVNIVKYLLKK